MADRALRGYGFRLRPSTKCLFSLRSPLQSLVHTEVHLQNNVDSFAKTVSKRKTRTFLFCNNPLCTRKCTYKIMSTVLQKLSAKEKHGCFYFATIPCTLSYMEMFMQCKIWMNYLLNAKKMRPEGRNVLLNFKLSNFYSQVLNTSFIFLS